MMQNDHKFKEKITGNAIAAATPAEASFQASGTPPTPSASKSSPVPAAPLPSAPTPALRADSLSVGYRGRAVVRDVEILVRPGEILTLIGPNGVGKSTVLKSIARQLSPISGVVYLNGAPLNELPGKTVARTMSILLTSRVEPELMTCRDVVSAGRYPYTGHLGILTAEDRAQVDAAMDLVHIRELEETDFSQISDGQRQRVMLARAICQQPQVLALDEPTSYLDIRYKLELLDILKELARKRNVTVIMTLHETDLAQKISDQVLCVNHGRVERCGPPEEIFADDYIARLYELDPQNYNTAFGCLELTPASGAPQVFVVGGGGSGIPVYRALQRQQVPFAAGILHQNDLDFPVARMLAARLVSETAYAPIREETFDAAWELILSCGQLICCTDTFGPINEKNRLLLERTRQKGIPVRMNLR